MDCTARARAGSSSDLSETWSRKIRGGRAQAGTSMRGSPYTAHTRARRIAATTTDGATVRPPASEEWTMATKEMSAHAIYAGGMRFDVTGGTGHALIEDVGAADGGQDQGFRPMELLLVGLAGCTGM